MSLQEAFDYINNSKWAIAIMSAVIFGMTEWRKYKKQQYLKVDNPRISQLLRRSKEISERINKNLFIYNCIFTGICVISMLFCSPMFGCFGYLLLSPAVTYLAMGPELSREFGKNSDKDIKLEKTERSKAKDAKRAAKSK